MKRDNLCLIIKLQLKIDLKSNTFRATDSTPYIFLNKLTLFFVLFIALLVNTKCWDKYMDY